MTDTQKQAVQRFVAILIAEVATLIVAALSSPELVNLISVWAGEGSLTTTLILALLPPLIAAIAKWAAGPTQKVTESSDPEIRSGRRERRITTGEPPGLFG